MQMTKTVAVAETIKEPLEHTAEEEASEWEIEHQFEK